MEAIEFIEAFFMQCRRENMLTAKKWVSEKLHKSSEALNIESNARSKDLGTSIYEGRKYIVIVFALTLCAIAEIFLLATPPEDIAKTISENSEKYFPFAKGKIFFSKTIEGEFNPNVKKYEISLPFRDLHKLEGFDASSTWYAFEIQIPEARFRKNETGLLIPKVWGESRFYIDGILRDFGNDVRSVIPLTNSNAKVVIQSNFSKTIKTAPITATYPLVSGNINDLRSLALLVDVQNETTFRILAMYGLAMMLFGMLFVAYPQKPELLWFILFLLSSAGEIVGRRYETFNSFFQLNNFAVEAITLANHILTHVSLLGFTLFFFRAHYRYVKDKLLFSLGFTFTVSFACTFLLHKMTNARSYLSIGETVLGFTYLGFQATTIGPRLIASIKNSNIPLVRKATMAAIGLTIFALYSMNIADYFVVLVTVTTLPRNNLILHVAIAVIMAYETARAEINQAIFGSMLPVEVKESLNQRKRSIDQTGFIVLLDALGYSSNRNRFEDRNKRANYIEQMAQKMLQPISKIKGHNFSILNCTGDGIYCAIRGKPSQENFNKILSVVVEIINSNSDHSLTEEKIYFRAAIGYGNYGVRVIEVGKIRKEFVAGNILNDLARIIGNGSAKDSIRILISDEMSSLVTEKEISEVTDKHGFVHRYIEVSKTKRAA